MSNKFKTVQERLDGWQNIISGIGVALRDKRLGSDVQVEILSQFELESLWRGDDLAGRIVELIPNEMMREGYDIIVRLGNEASTDQGDRTDFFGAPTTPMQPKPIKKSNDLEKKTSKQLKSKLDDLGTDRKLWQALCYQRAFGGGAILIGANDGLDPSKPLDLNRIKSVDWLTVLSAFELYPVAYYSDPSAPRYGEPELYRLQQNNVVWGIASVAKGIETSALIHESRLLRFEGIVTTREQRLQSSAYGWGDSIFIRIFSVLRDFGMSWSAACVLLIDFGQAVYKIKGLAEMLAQDEDQAVVDRAKMIDYMRSTVNGVLLDSEETFERQSPSLTGFSDLLNMLGSRVSASTGIPVTLLMGTSPGGLNATGSSDIRLFYDSIKTRQRTQLKPNLERLIKIVMLAKDSPTKGQEPDIWEVIFKSLWQPSEKEQVEARKIQADIDVAYINAGVVSPEEVCASRFGSGMYSFDTYIDFDSRNESLLTKGEEQEVMQNETKEIEEKNNTTKVETNPTKPDSNKVLPRDK